MTPEQIQQIALMVALWREYRGFLATNPQYGAPAAPGTYPGRVGTFEGFMAWLSYVWWPANNPPTPPPPAEEPES